MRPLHALFFATLLIAVVGYALGWLLAAVRLSSIAGVASLINLALLVVIIFDRHKPNQRRS